MFVMMLQRLPEATSAGSTRNYSKNIDCNLPLAAIGSKAQDAARCMWTIKRMRKKSQERGRFSLYNNFIRTGLNSVS